MKLETYLKKHGISRKEFSVKVGSSTETVRLWLIGDRIPHPKYRAAISKETGGAVKLSDFVRSKFGRVG
jgi:transcriptional regulator with XRE-family HTH domain